MIWTETPGGPAKKRSCPGTWEARCGLHSAAQVSGWRGAGKARRPGTVRPFPWLKILFALPPHSSWLADTRCRHTPAGPALQESGGHCPQRRLTTESLSRAMRSPTRWETAPQTTSLCPKTQRSQTPGPPRHDRPAQGFPRVTVTCVHGTVPPLPTLGLGNSVQPNLLGPRHPQ